MNEGSWVGLDVHARSVVAGVIDAGSGEVRSLRVPPGSEETVGVVEDVAGAGPGRVRGGTDRVSGLRVRVRRRGSLRGRGAVEDPAAAADRVKTDRRDAERLARLLRLGEITAVRVPEPEEEAARDLVRAREDARGDLMRARHRLSKLLLAPWGWCTTRPRGRGPTTRGFAGSGSTSGPLAIVFDECYGRMLDAKTRRDALDKAITELAATPPYVDVVERLVCLRGVSTLTAFALTVELGDWNRFRPESLGPFLGLTPSENSSGERRRQGAITKTGNSHARRLLIEAAWHHRGPPRLSLTLERRRTGKPLAVRAQADRSARRLHGRWHALESPRQAAARSSWSPSPANSPGTAGRSQRWSSRRHQRLGEESAPAQRREERPERTAASSPNTGHARRQRTAPLLISHTRSCGTNPRI